jgi:hypothetical protein
MLKILRSLSTLAVRVMNAISLGSRKFNGLPLIVTSGRLFCCWTDSSTVLWDQEKIRPLPISPLTPIPSALVHCFAITIFLRLAKVTVDINSSLPLLMIISAVVDFTITLTPFPHVCTGLVDINTVISPATSSEKVLAIIMYTWNI